MSYSVADTLCGVLTVVLSPSEGDLGLKKHGVPIYRLVLTLCACPEKLTGWPARLKHSLYLSYPICVTSQLLPLKTL